MSDLDVRWKQRLGQYEKALQTLSEFVAQIDPKAISKLESHALIQAFEYTHELAWNVMKDFFAYQGTTSITGSRDATREAFQRDLVTDGDGWMDMVRARNLTSHAYNEQTATEVALKVHSHYHVLFQAFAKKMKDIADAQ